MKELFKVESIDAKRVYNRIDGKLFFDCYKKGLSDKQMAETLGCTRAAVCSKRNSLSLKANKVKRKKNKKSTAKLNVNVQEICRIERQEFIKKVGQQKRTIEKIKKMLEVGKEVEIAEAITGKIGVFGEAGHSGKNATRTNAAVILEKHSNIFVAQVKAHREAFNYSDILAGLVKISA